jgi:SAF domain
MIDYQKFIQRNSRRIYASAALVAALFAGSILLNSGPTGTAWVVRNSISSGSIITALDVSSIQVNLATDAAHYVSAKEGVIGQFATRTLSPGDLISTSDVTKTSAASEVRYLPLGIALEDLPIAMSAGDHADIYVIPKQASLGPALVVSNVSIHQIDNKSRALGGNVEIEVSVGIAAAMNLVDAESQGRLVVSRHAF